MMKILLSPPNSADSRHQSQQQITTVSESQLNHYLKLHAAQQHQQQQSQSPLALLKRDPAIEDSKLHPAPRPTAVGNSPSLLRQYNHLAATKAEAMPSTTNVITSNLSAIQTQQYHRHLQPQNGHHVEGSGSTKSKFSTTPNQPPLPHKKLIMGKIEHNEALENEAAMQQHAQNLLQLSQEPLVLHNQRASSPQLSQQPHQQHHPEKDPPPQSRPEELVYHQRLRDSSVGYFMEVGPTTPSIHFTTAGIEADTRNAENLERQPFQHRQFQQQHYSHGLLQSRIFPKDEPMSPRLVSCYHIS